MPCIKISSNFSRVCVFVCIREINTWINVWMCLWISMENNKWSNRNLCSNCNRYFFLLRILRLSAQSKTYISIVQKRRSAFTDAYARNAQNCTWQNCVRKCQKFFPRNKSVFTWENVIPTILRLFTLYKCNPILVKLPRTNTIGMFILKETQKSITKN